GKQLKPLARQAEAAKRGAAVQAELRDAKLKLAGDQVVRLRATFADAERAAEMLAEQVETVNATLETAVDELEALEARQHELQPQ
ncbi:hypothetical protein, partial [Pseudomonas aeruginosa]